MTAAPGPFSTASLGVAAFLLAMGFELTRLDVLEDRLAFTFEGRDVRLAGFRANSSRRKPHADELEKLFRVLADRIARGDITSGVEANTEGS
ncbi:MAG TPA: hypothetical protein VMW69_13985 [Spirochaetia bacterium]|nr:hypothetical protein [Spirochaetia bacterium]